MPKHILIFTGDTLFRESEQAIHSAKSERLKRVAKPRYLFHYDNLRTRASKIRLASLRQRIGSQNRIKKIIERRQHRKRKGRKKKKKKSCSRKRTQ